MVEKYGFFDSTSDDERVYSQADFARFVKSITRDGIHGDADALAVSPALTGLGVTVGAGRAVVDGYFYELADDGSGAKTISLTAAKNYPRIDRIVLRLNSAARTITLAVRTGTENNAPQAPAIERSSSMYELSLAQVYVAIGAGSIKEADITDERSDEALCGCTVVSPDAALAAAQTADAKAEAAGTAAAQADAKAQGILDGGVVQSVNGQSGAVQVKVGVSGAQEGNIPVFDANGDIVTSGKSLYDFTRMKATFNSSTGILALVTVS